MYIAIRQQAQEVHLSMILALVDQCLPRIGLEDVAAFDRLIDQLGTLAVDLSASQCVMTDLAVSHISITR